MTMFVQAARRSVVAYRPILLPVALWVLFMIALPIVNWTWGAAALQRGVALSVLVQAAVIAIVLSTVFSVRRIGVIFAFVAVATLLIEAVGTATGLPFGRYVYTDLLQPQLLHVPLLIPLAWFMMLPPAWAVARRFYDRPVMFAAVSAVALTAWDLFLDPQMVQWGFWVWENPVGYFGIPWINYGGWLLTAFFITYVVRRFILNQHSRHLTAIAAPLMLIYTVTWFLMTFGLALFWNLPGPAIVGGLVMGSFVWLGWRT